MRTLQRFLPLLLAAPLAAQGFVVVPNGYENLEGTSASRTPFGWSSGRVQYLVDGDQLCQNIAVITALRLRLDGGNFNVDAPVSKTFQATLDAYEVPLTPATMSANWSTNIGSAVATPVYNGALTIPAAARQYPYPNPWTIDIPLSQPLVYNRSNGNLLLDLIVTGGTGDNWPADGFFFHATEARGEITRIWEDTGCATALGSLSLAVPMVAGNGVVGSTLAVNHTVSPGPGANLDFVLHYVSLDNQQLGGAPLPLPLGFLGAPGCQWNTGVDLGAIVPAGAGGQVWQLPATPAAIGVALYTQAAAIDFVAGELVPSRNAWQVRIGPAAAAAGPAQMVHQSNYFAQSTGALSPTGYYGLVIGFVGVFQ